MAIPLPHFLTSAAVVVSTVLAVGFASPAAAATEQPGRMPAGLVHDPAAPPPPADLTASAWLVADLETGEVLAAKDAHAQYPPASTLKVLTAVSLLPRVPVDAEVVPTQAEVAVEGSKVGLVPGLTYSGEQLYSSLLMVSGNDAANALGGAAGGPEAAAALMNETAQRLGAVDTHAVNQHGLDAEGQVTTPYDMAIIGRAALEQPDIARWAAMRHSVMPGGPGKPPFEIYNKNKLLTNYEGALGIKNGYTSRSRATFIGAAERNGHRLVATLLHADPKVWAEAGRLLDWGFAALAAGASPVGQLPIRSEPAEVDVAAAASTGETVTVQLTSDQPAARDGLEVPTQELAGIGLMLAAAAVVRPSRGLAPTRAART